MALTLAATLERLHLLIRAGYPVIYIVSHEEARVLGYLETLHHRLPQQGAKKALLRWSAAYGLLVHESGRQLLAADRDPFDYLASTTNLDRDPIDATNCLAVFVDVHRRLTRDSQILGNSLVRPLRNAADALRRYYEANRARASARRTAEFPFKTIVIIAPTAHDLSAELSADAIVIQFPLPEQEELRRTIEAMVAIGALRHEEHPADDDYWAVMERREAEPGASRDVTAYRLRLTEMLAGAGRGLPLEDFKLGLNLFSVRNEPLNARRIDDMLSLKAKAISNPALEYTPHVQMELGGLEGVKTWIRTREAAVRYQSVREKYHLPAPRGMMLFGASGGGKSQLAKWTAKQFKLALLRLDIGALFGQYVGESEARTRDALRLAEVLAPVVLWLDEIDKAFTALGGAGDNGVSARVFGTFLTWLAEKRDEVFVVATANDFSTLNTRFPELTRRGRFDEIFAVGIPGPAERAAIFEIYLRRHFEESSPLFDVTRKDVDALAQRLGIATGAPAERPVAGLAEVLASNQMSQNMTGAEIEYAVIDFLYRNFAAQGTLSTASALDLLASAVRDARSKALYGTPPGQAAMTALDAATAAGGWCRA